MFGWEFPPHISGGLGTACAGLTHALEKGRVDILFTVPRLRGGEKVGGTEFLNASTIPIPELKSRSVAKKTHASALCIPDDLSATSSPYKSVGERTTIEIPSNLSPYASTVETQLVSGLEHWNYAFKHPADRTSPASRRNVDASRENTADLKEPYHFSGTYGANLLDEVERYALAGAEIAKQYTFDVIHAHDWMTFPAGIEAKKITGKPLIVHVHATEIDRSGAHVNARVFAIEKEGMAQADKVVTVSHWTKNIAIQHYEVDEKKIEVVHNGVTPKENALPPQQAPDLGARIVTFLGRITHQKGPMYFVEAARAVHEKFPDAHFVVAGSGDQLPQMIERIAQVRLSKNFHFTGFLRAEDVSRIWSMSHVYVMPSVSEPFGIAPLEAIQAGVPVIISKQAGVSEVVEHAMKVDFWDSAALAEAICNVLRFKSLSNTLKKNGAEQLKDITWEKAAKKLTTLYYELSSKHEKSEKYRSVLSGAPTQKTEQPSLL